MNKRIKTKWLKALRSGEYKQTTGTLRNDKGYCCLGVLCDIYAKEAGKRWVKAKGYNNDGSRRIAGQDSVLPEPVVKWAKLEQANPRVLNEHRISFSLSQLNDNLHKDFKEIADLIEKSL